MFIYNTVNTSFSVSEIKLRQAISICLSHMYRMTDLRREPLFGENNKKEAIIYSW